MGFKKLKKFIRIQFNCVKFSSLINKTKKNLKKLRVILKYIKYFINYLSKQEYPKIIKYYSNIITGILFLIINGFETSFIQ